MIGIRSIRFQSWPIVSGGALCRWLRKQASKQASTHASEHAINLRSSFVCRLASASTAGDEGGGGGGATAAVAVLLKVAAGCAAGDSGGVLSLVVGSVAGAG